MYDATAKMYQNENLCTVPHNNIRDRRDKLKLPNALLVCI